MVTAVDYETKTGDSTHTPYVSDIPVTPELIRLPVTGGPLSVARYVMRYETIHPLQFIDITDDVERVVAMSGITEGTVTVFSKHTTAAIKINEHEPELLKDMGRVLASFAPDSRYYFHNDFTVRWVNMVEDECPNGHANCRLAETCLPTSIWPLHLACSPVPNVDAHPTAGALFPQGGNYDRIDLQLTSSKC